MSAKTKSPLLSAPVLVVMLALLLAVAGVVYAHWTSTLRVEANVQTGSVYTEWLSASTNDDGHDDGDGELTDYEVWDFWGNQSSADPASEDFVLFEDGRYTKDVAGCWAGIGGDTLNIWVSNAYPSYHCAVRGELANKGSIPVRVTSIAPQAHFENRCGYWEDQYGDPGGLYEGDQIGWDDEGPFFDDNLNGELDGPDYRLYEDCRSGPMDFVPGDVEGNFALAFQDTAEIVGDIALGLRCGFQIDPIPCEWRFVEGDAVWDGHVDQCRPGDGTEEQACAYNDEDVFEGIVYESCGGPTYPAEGWFHVEQEADQNTNYYWSFEQNFVNWNEWSPDLCSPGAEIVNPDGSPYIP